MKTKSSRETIGVLALLLPAIVQAEIAVPLDALEVNLVGVAVASVPDYWGSSKNEGAMGPYGRYQFAGSQRYIEVLGPQLATDRRYREFNHKGHG